MQARSLTRPDDPPENLGSFANVAGQFYAAKGRSDLSEAEFRRAVELFIEAEEPDDVAGMRNNLANALRDLGRFDEAERQYRLSLDYMEKRLGPEHPEWGRSTRGSLGSFKPRATRSERSEHVAVPMTTGERRRVPTTRRSACCRSTSANLSTRWGDSRREKRRCAPHSSSSRKTLGPRHAAVGMAKQNLSVTAAMGGRHEDAVALLREALDIALESARPRSPRRRPHAHEPRPEPAPNGSPRRGRGGAARSHAHPDPGYGPDHHEVCDARERRALTLQALGREDEAESELARAWEDRRRLQGKRTPIPARR